MKGALLVGAAVILGIVLLQIVDPGKSGPVASRSTSPTSSTTSTTSPGKKNTTPTTTKKAAAKTPAQVRLLVLNAGAPNGQAGSVLATLKTHGYTNAANAANTDPNHRVGNQVLCRSGLTREATTLATLLGPHATKGVLVAGSTAPPGSTGFDCVALIGA